MIYNTLITFLILGGAGVSIFALTKPNTPLLVLAILSFVIGMVLTILKIRYHLWRKRTIAKLEAGSEIIKTDRGLVEYRSVGQGPVVILSHGVGTGYDNMSLYEYLADQGFRVIGVSRPGHLRTPLESGKTAADQAHLYAALMDSLTIEKAAFIGVSGGGPSVIEFAGLYPNRIQALVLEAAVSKKYTLDEAVANSFIGKLFLDPKIQGPGSWVFFNLSMAAPKGAFIEMAGTLTTHDKKTLTRNVETLMARETGFQEFKQFMEMTIPMDLRGRGQDNDIKTLTNLPETYEIGNKTVPVLILHDRYDGDAVYEHAEFSKKLFPQAKVITLGEDKTGLGHLMFFGAQGERVKQERNMFLKKHLFD